MSASEFTNFVALTTNNVVKDYFAPISGFIRWIKSIYRVPQLLNSIENNNLKVFNLLSEVVTYSNNIASMEYELSIRERRLYENQQHTHKFIEAFLETSAALPNRIEELSKPIIQFAKEFEGYRQSIKDLENLSKPMITISRELEGYQKTIRDLERLTKPMITIPRELEGYQKTIRDLERLTKPMILFYEEFADLQKTTKKESEDD